MTDVDGDLRAIATAVHVLSRHLHRAALHSVGLDPLPQSEVEVLQHVRAYPDATVSDVARALRLQTSNVSTAVRSLTARSLLERHPDPADQRRVRLRASPLAERHRAQLERAWSDTLARLLPQLGDHDAADLRAAAGALERLAAAVVSDALR